RQVWRTSATALQIAAGNAQYARLLGADVVGFEKGRKRSLRIPQLPVGLPVHLAVAALHVGDHRVGLGLRQLPGEPLAIRRPEHVQVAVMIAAQSQTTLAVRLPLLLAFHSVAYAGVSTATPTFQ